MVLTNFHLPPFNKSIMKNPNKISKVGVVLIIIAAVLAMACLLFLNNQLASIGTSTDTQAGWNKGSTWNEKQEAKQRKIVNKINKNSGQKNKSTTVLPGYIRPKSLEGSQFVVPGLH